jgi:mannose-1-phosphate guanylyltransferase
MVEKPPWEVAERLFSQNALWNTFILVSEAAALLHLIRLRHPIAVEILEIAHEHDRESGLGSQAVEEIYGLLPSIDFSADVVAGQESRVGVVGVPPCGWTDLGTPDRVLSVLRQPGNSSRLMRERFLEGAKELSLLRRCNNFIDAISTER